MSPLKQLKQVSPGSTLLPGSIEKAAAEQTYRNLAGNVPPSNNLAGSPPVNAGTPAAPPLANAELNMQVNPGAVPPDQMNPASPVAQNRKRTARINKRRAKREQRRASKTSGCNRGSCSGGRR